MPGLPWDEAPLGIEGRAIHMLGGASYDRSADLLDVSFGSFSKLNNLVSRVGVECPIAVNGDGLLFHTLDMAHGYLNFRKRFVAWLN
jgi:hypothetical protein